METHNILQLFMASTRMFRNFISHNETHKNPPPNPYIFFLLASHKKIAKFYRDVTLLFMSRGYGGPGGAYLTSHLVHTK